MVESDSVSERLLESRVLDPIEMRLEILLLDVEESLPFLVGEAVGEDVVRSKLALLSRRDEGDDGLLASPVVDGEVGGFGHSEHERREVRDVVALDVDVHGERSSAEEKEGKDEESVRVSKKKRRRRGEKAHLGAKLKTFCVEAPSQSPRSRAFASETLQATILVGFPVWDETNRVREMRTS